MIAGTGKALSIGLVACCLAAFAPHAVAADQDGLAGCSTLSDAIERPDGSIIAVGSTGDCPTLGNPYPETRMLLANFTEGGFSGTEFNGATFLTVPSAPSEWAKELIARPDGGFFLVTNRRVISYLANGEPDGTFGNQGQVFPVEGMVSYASVQDAELESDGSILVARGTYGDLRVSRYLPDGSLAEDFGVDGVTSLDLGDASALAVDPEGRIILASFNGLARLDAQGGVDLTFGEHGTGYADLPADLSMNVEGIFEVSFAPDGKVQVAGFGNRGFYSNPGFLVTFDPDGRPIAGEEHLERGHNPRTIMSYPGGFAYGDGASRGSTPRFSVGTFSLPSSTSYLISPGESGVNGIAAMADGSLLAVGTSGGFNCVSRCEPVYSMSLAKLDPDTGELVKSFGVNGTRLMQPNECAFGRAGVSGEWKICRVLPPGTTGSVRFHGFRKPRPSATVLASLGSPPADIWGTRQRISLTLPKHLKLKKGGLNGRITAKIAPDIEADLSLKLKGRRITILVEPEYMPYDIDKRFRVRIQIKRGALAPFRKQQKLSQMNFTLTGTFIPIPDGLEPGTWSAPNSKTSTFRAGVK